MSGDEVAQLVPHAARLVGTVRDYGPADVAAVLAQTPGGRLDALAVVLASMVDPDARPSELLAWTETGPVVSRPGFDPHRPQVMCTDCGELVVVSSLERHKTRHTGRVARASVS